MPSQHDSHGQQGASVEQSLSHAPSNPVAESVGAHYQGIDSPASANESTQEVKKTNQELDSIRRGEMWVIGLNVGLFIVGAVVCIIYGLQLSVMKSQLQVMRAQLADSKTSGTQTTEQTRQLIEQAKTQANNTGVLASTSQQQTAVWTDLVNQSKRQTDIQGKQVDIQSRQVQLGRANLRIFFVGLYKLGHDDAPLFNIKFKNAGRMDAYQVAAAAYVKFLLPQQKRSYPSMNESKALEAQSIVPEGQIQTGTQPIIEARGEKPTASIWNEYMQRKRNLYVWGRVWYKDNMGKPDPFEFCFFLNATDATEITTARGVTIRDCPGSVN